MVRKFRIGLSLMLATSVFTGAVPARGPQPEKAAFGNAMFRADMTYTEEGSIKIRDPKKPKDTDDSDFTLRINATFSRAVQMTNDGSGMTLAECMEWNPDGGCKVYSPLSYGGSVVYGTTATLHSEHYPPELPDVTTFNTKANFSGVLLPESSATMSEENFTAIAFDLHVGMKGDCEFSMLRNWTAVEISGRSTIQVPKSESKASKLCKEPLMPVTYGPSSVDGVKAQGTDAPEPREIKFNAVACNTNPQYCAEQKAAAAQLGETGAMAELESDVWLGGTTAGDMKHGYKFHFEGTRDMSKFRIPAEGTGTWRSALTIDASVTPVTKTPGKPSVAELTPDFDKQALLPRKVLRVA